MPVDLDLTPDDRALNGNSPSVEAKKKPTFYSRLRRLWMVCLAAGILYVLSFGPACWILTRFDAQENHIHFRTVSKIYEPVSVSAIHSPAWARNTVLWYLELGASPDARVHWDRPTAIGWDKPGYSYTLLSIGVD